MKRADASIASVILTGCCIAAAIVLFRGFSPVLLALLPLTVAAALSLRTWPGRVALVLLALSFASEDALPWAVLVAGGLCAFAGTGPAVRGLGFAALAVVIWFLPILNTLPLLIASAAAAFLYEKPRAALFLLPAGVLVSVFFTGIPVTPGERSHTARSFVEEGRIAWSIPELNAHRTQMRLPAPPQGEWVMWLALEGGGVRDTMPMMAVEIDEYALFLPAGFDTLSFTMFPGDTLMISLLRQSRPFTHPVVHVQAAGELL